MSRRFCLALVVAVLALDMWLGTPRPAAAQSAQPAPQSLQRFYYYPYYYFPHNYWPAQGPKWPEPVGAPYRKPPAYMAYPPFREPNWRYDLFEPAPYYHGSHFWLDQF